MGGIFSGLQNSILQQFFGFAVIGLAGGLAVAAATASGFWFHILLFFSF
jgi:hypothetical protein